MTLPIRDEDDATPVDPPDGGGRPEWMVDTSADLGQVPARTAPTPPAAATSRLGDLVVRPRAPAGAERIEGLVGPEVAEVPIAPDSSTWNERPSGGPTSPETSNSAHPTDSVAAAPAAPPPPAAQSNAPFKIRLAADPPAPPRAHPEPEPDPAPEPALDTSELPASWSAAASSIPSLRRSRQRAAPAEAPTPDITWDEAPAAPHAAPVEPHAPVRPHAPVVQRPPNPFAGVLQLASRVPMLVYAITVGVVVVLWVSLPLLRPKQKFDSIREIKAHARARDGQVVHLEGSVGQSFPVGGGFTFYLHKSRDTIVVFTRYRTPVEGEKVKLLGTVSTGMLDGAPRAVIFEDPPPSQ